MEGKKDKKNLRCRVAMTKDLYQDSDLVEELQAEAKRTENPKVRDWAMATIYTGRNDLTYREVVKYSGMAYSGVYGIEEDVTEEEMRDILQRSYIQKDNE